MSAPPRVRLERPTARHRIRFLAAVHRSRRLHAPWVSPPASAAAYSAYLRRLRASSHVGHLVCLRNSGDLVGVINISEIVRGAFRSAYLGYYAFVPHAGRGLMCEGLTLAISDAFRRQGLHRLEANIQPGNRASRRLVRRLGFKREGYSRRYLKIRGRWCDHERWAILTDEWRERPVYRVSAVRAFSPA
jgi:[ribosomal protein S5]-alanine N-acetyltransferase